MRNANYWFKAKYKLCEKGEWKTKDGSYINVNQMSSRYIKNVINFLEKRGVRFTSNEISNLVSQAGMEETELYHDLDSQIEIETDNNSWWDGEPDYDSMYHYLYAKGELSSNIKVWWDEEGNFRWKKMSSEDWEN